MFTSNPSTAATISHVLPGQTLQDTRAPKRGGASTDVSRYPTSELGSARFTEVKLQAQRTQIVVNAIGPSASVEELRGARQMEAGFDKINKPGITPK